MKDLECISVGFRTSLVAKKELNCNPSIIDPKQFPARFRYQMPMNNVPL